MTECIVPGCARSARNNLGVRLRRRDTTAEGRLIIEGGGPLNGIRALFADEVFVKSLTADYEEGELERLVAALGEHYQPALNRFAQAAVGRYLNDLPEGVVQFEGAAAEPE